jgi:hypothetical protein
MFLIGGKLEAESLSPRVTRDFQAMDGAGKDR